MSKTPQTVGEMEAELAQLRRIREDTANHDAKYGDLTQLPGVHAGTTTTGSKYGDLSDIGIKTKRGTP